MTLQNLMVISLKYVILRFRVDECVGQDANNFLVTTTKPIILGQIRRYRGKIDDVVDVVTNDGYLVRLKPLIITQASPDFCKASYAFQDQGPS